MATTTSTGTNANAAAGIAAPRNRSVSRAPAHETAAPENGAHANVADARSLSDDEILGLDLSAPGKGTRAADPARRTAGAQPVAPPHDPLEVSADAPADAANSEADVLTEIVEPEELRGIFDANPDLRQAWRAEKAYREVFPSIDAAREIAQLFPTVEDARAAGTQLADLAQLDSWFFSGQPQAHADLAAAVYRLNPAAFRGLAHAMRDFLARAESGSATESPRRGESGKARTENGQAANAPGGSELQSVVADFSRPNSAKAGPHAENDNTAGDSATSTPAGAGFADHAAQAGEPVPPGRFAAFYQETNAEVVEGVMNAIETQVGRLLPEGVAPGAQKRVIAEVYRELDASLRANRSLAQQVRQAFRSGAMDADHQAAVAGLILGRAKQALPAVAKKVIGEWTTGVLAANQEKLARQRGAASRVDITGSGGIGGGIRRPLTPGEIDYGKLSDGDILNL
jgi:hypothetical protein